MDIPSILDPQRIRCAVPAGSKKVALDALSQVLASAADGPGAAEILEGLASRERLGSTGLGKSVAMPHARIPGLAAPIGAFLKLAEAVEFDSADGKPVDLLFGLLIPAESAASELKTMRQIVEKLRDPRLQDSLRDSDDPQELFELLTDNLTIIRRMINV